MFLKLGKGEKFIPLILKKSFDYKKFWKLTSMYCFQIDWFCSIEFMFVPLVNSEQTKNLQRIIIII